MAKQETKGKEKHPGGRPQASIKELPKGWQKQIVDLYKIGGNDVEVKALIYEWRGSFSNDLFARWINQEPEFSEIIKGGRLLSEAWWLMRGRTNLSNKEFHAVLWYMNMKNRFGWTDRQDITTKGKALSDEELRDQRKVDSVLDLLTPEQLAQLKERGVDIQDN